MTSAMSLADLAAFYEGAIKEIGARGESHSIDGTHWQWDGTYDDKLLIIYIEPSGASAWNITIRY